MVSFTSSTVNKSGKKFAPKAPPRRTAAASSTPTSTPVQPDGDNHVISRPTQPPPSNVTTPPSASEPAVERRVETSQATPDSPRKRLPSEARKVAEAATPIPIPTPKSRPVSSVPARTVKGPRRESHSTEASIPISIPIPKPKSSDPFPKLNTDTSDALEPRLSNSASLTTQPTSTPLENEQQVHGTDSPTTRRKRSLVETITEKTSSAGTDIPEQVESALHRSPKRAKPSPKVSGGTSENALPRGTSESRSASETPGSQKNPVIPTGTTTLPSKKRIRNPTQPKKNRSHEVTRTGSSADGAELKRSRARKKRQPTPEDAESAEITPAVMKMSELCKDNRTGKMSKREIELRNIELVELERKQKEREEGKSGTPVMQSTEKGESSNLNADSVASTPSKIQTGPRMRIVNGEIVIDAASLQVDRHADASRGAGELEDVVENKLTRKINQATYGKRTKTESWDEDMTDLFYRGLRMFGTDFMVISKMFPGRSRRQIKLKFNNEERRDPARVKETLLGPREAVDIETYSAMTNTVYDDPRAIQKELDEDKKRIEEQHAKEKQAQEELLRNPSGGDKDIIPSIETPNTHKGRSRNVKKTTSLKGTGGGTEEVLGSIDDLPIV